VHGGAIVDGRERRETYVSSVWLNSIHLDSEFSRIRYDNAGDSAVLGASRLS